MTVLEDILAKGEVEEELLVELSDEQKVVLFYKIRQEQIKRWEKHYNNVTDESKVNRKTEFLKGTDGNDWVWVMGDAPGDESYDQVWVKYALQYAEQEVAKQQGTGTINASINNNVPVSSVEELKGVQRVAAVAARIDAQTISEYPSANCNTNKELEETAQEKQNVDKEFFEARAVANEDSSKPDSGDFSLNAKNVITSVDEPQDSSATISSLSENYPIDQSGTSVEISSLEEAGDSRLTPTLEDENNQNDARDNFNFVDDDVDEKFPLEGDDNLDMLESVSNQNDSDSSEEHMPFPVEQPETDAQKGTEISNLQTAQENRGSSVSPDVVSESLGSVQDRMKAFGSTVGSKFQPKSRNAPAVPAIPVYRPKLSQNNLTSEPEMKFPVVTENRGTIAESVRPNSQNPNPNNATFEANFGRFNSYKPTPVQPPMYRPTYNGNQPMPFYAPQRTSPSTSDRTTWSASVNYPNNPSPVNRSHFSPNSSQNGSNMTFDYNISGSGSVLQPGSNFSSLSRTSNGSSGQGQIKTNPYARPPQTTQNGKPIVPPRNMTSYPHLNQSGQSHSPGPETPPLSSINLDDSVSQLIAKQNVMVQKFLRQSIIRDEEQANKLQATWEESERKAKEQDERLKQENQRYREMARRVINEQLPVPLSRAFLLSSDKSAADAAGPQSKQEVIQWFQREELDSRAGCEPQSGAICVWFHGIINRSKAEQLLRHLTIGSFLVRVSEKIFGYTLSYKSHDRCKHFLIDKHDGTYQFFGLNMKRHSCLYDLVNYHRNKPVSASGNELLVYPVGQVNGQPLDYAELFQRNLLLSKQNSANNHNSGNSLSSLPVTNGGNNINSAGGPDRSNAANGASSANTFVYPNRNLALATRF